MCRLLIILHEGRKCIWSALKVIFYYYCKKFIHMFLYICFEHSQKYVYLPLLYEK